MFDIRKATHVAAYLLWKRGRRMSSLKLMKMMYIAEKQFLLQYGEIDRRQNGLHALWSSSVCNL